MAQAMVPLSIGQSCLEKSISCPCKVTYGVPNWGQVAIFKKVSEVEPCYAYLNQLSQDLCECILESQFCAVEYFILSHFVGETLNKWCH